MENLPERDVLMSAEIQGNVAVLDSPAVGLIDPQTRVRKGEITNEKVDQLSNEMGIHYEWVDGEMREKAIPKWCVDGREDAEDVPLAPNAAGGSYSMVIGEALIDASALIANNETSASHGKKMFKSLVVNKYEVGAHIDNHATPEKCGCGACDRQAEIITFLAENIEELSTKAGGLGVQIEESLQAKIKTNANSLIAANYVSSGNDMIESVKEVAGDSSVQTLQGSHNEVVLAVNVNQVGKTLNRNAIREKFGNDYQAFNLDFWALKNGIKAISVNESEANEKLAAAVLYNIATACVLAGPSLRVVVV